MDQKHLLICWFRKNLRLHDNALLAQAAQKYDLLLPLYILDPSLISPLQSSANTTLFLLQSLHDMDRNLSANFQQRLFITHGNPLTVLSNLIGQLREKLSQLKKITLAFENDLAHYPKIRDDSVKRWALANQVNIETVTTQTLYDMKRLYQLGNNSVPQSMAQFEILISRAGAPPETLETPNILPKPPKQLFFGENDKNEILTYFGNVFFFEKVPTLRQLKLPASGPNSPFQGGETVALKRLYSFFKDQTTFMKFNENSDNPTHHHPPSATHSPYLAQGCLSPRLLLKNLKMIGQPQTNPQTQKLIKKLQWREFFHLIGSYTENFRQMTSNPVNKLRSCWQYNPKFVNAWEHGKTGFPVIDAVMRQIRRDGWTHHLNKQLVSCFFTQGFMWQSWEIGLKHFQQMLIDHDWHQDTGNWIWLSNVNLNPQDSKVRFLRCGKYLIEN